MNKLGIILGLCFQTKIITMTTATKDQKILHKFYQIYLNQKNFKEEELVNFKVN